MSKSFFSCFGMGLFLLLPSGVSLPEKVVQHAQEVLEQPTFEFVSEKQLLRGDPQLFSHLLQHIDLCATAANHLGIDSYQAKRLQDGRIYGTRGEASAGYLRLLFQNDGVHHFLLEGEHRGIVAVKGDTYLKVVLIPTENPTQIYYQMHAWVRINNGFFAFLSKIFKSYSKSSAERELKRMLRVPVALTESYYEDPRKVTHGLSDLGAQFTWLFQPTAEYSTSATHAPSRLGSR